MKTKIATVITIAMLSAPVMAQQNLNSLDSQVFANQNIKAVEIFLGLIIIPIDFVIYLIIKKYFPKNGLMIFIQIFTLSLINFLLLKYILKF